MKRCKCCGQVQLWTELKDLARYTWKLLSEFFCLPKFMVVGVDNFARDHIDESVVLEGISKQEAEEFAAKLNESFNDYSSTRYVVKPNDYVPYKFTGY